MKPWIVSFKRHRIGLSNCKESNFNGISTDWPDSRKIFEAFKRLNDGHWDRVSVHSDEHRWEHHWHPIWDRHVTHDGYDEQL